jgi:hypothetical protein
LDTLHLGFVLSGLIWSVECRGGSQEP